MSARGELKAYEADVYFRENTGDRINLGHSIWIDEVEIMGTREQLEEFIGSQIEEFGGLTDPDHVCKQGADGHGEVPEPRTIEHMMDWASYMVTSFKGEAEMKNLARSVWVCDKPSCVADAAGWALRAKGATTLTIRHQPTGDAEGTLVTLDSVLGTVTGK